jgi:hypothetical protein
MINTTFFHWHLFSERRQVISLDTLLVSGTEFIETDPDSATLIKWLGRQGEGYAILSEDRASYSFMTKTFAKYAAGDNICALFGGGGGYFDYFRVRGAGGPVTPAEWASCVLRHLRECMKTAAAIEDPEARGDYEVGVVVPHRHDLAALEEMARLGHPVALA